MGDKMTKSLKQLQLAVVQARTDLCAALANSAELIASAMVGYRKQIELATDANKHTAVMIEKFEQAVDELEQFLTQNSPSQQ